MLKYVWIKIFVQYNWVNNLQEKDENHMTSFISISLNYK